MKAPVLQSWFAWGTPPVLTALPELRPACWTWDNTGTTWQRWNSHVCIGPPGHILEHGDSLTPFPPKCVFSHVQDCAPNQLCLCFHSFQMSCSQDD